MAIERTRPVRTPDNRVVAYASLAAAGKGAPIWRATNLSIPSVLLAVVLSIWAVIGFLFWVPLIVRATVGFCITATYANLVAPNAGVPNQRLQHAALFYVNGFRSIARGVLQPHASEPSLIPTFRSGRFLAEALWALFFWWVSLLILAYLGIAFTLFQDQLTYPAFWIVDQGSAGWNWLIEQMDRLLQWGSGISRGTPQAS